MNNFFSRFYFFSKLSISFVLLILLFIISYLFIKAYLNQNISMNNNIKTEDLSMQLDTLYGLVEQNSGNINAVKDLVIINKQSFDDVILNVKELQKNMVNNDLLLKTNQLSKEKKELEDKLNSLVLKFNNTSIINQDIPQNNQSKIYLKNLVNLIKLKLNNGNNFIEEVELLYDFQRNEEQISYIEKLSILSRNNFIGLNKLNDDLKHLTSNYLQNYYLKKNKNSFLKYFTNFISIEPSLNDNIQDKTVNILSLAKKNFQEKNIKESINNFSSLDEGRYYFGNWIEQAEYYVEVRNILNNLINEL